MRRNARAWEVVIDREKLINDTTLMLTCLISQKEDVHVGTVTRSWKGYDWGAIDTPCDEGLINAPHRARSVYLANQEKGHAKQLAASHEAFDAVVAETEH